ncbi:MAG: DEAD/DEAH box helicase family protein [Vampirovibrio sp.]
MSQKIVNSIAGRLSLRTPQRHSLDLLARLTEIVPPRKDADVQQALEIIRSEYPLVTDFERDFPSLCFALATGVGKTRLMGAFITYLHQACGFNTYFILAPNLTIYNKLIGDFTPSSPKYVFKGISEFAIKPPIIVTGENYESGEGVRGDMLPDIAVYQPNLFRVNDDVVINIFNISKINTEVRGGRNSKIRSFKETLGQSYFEYLASQPDLVLLMDESHRYRASAGLRAINELKPVLGLELTATPFSEGSKGAIPFKNVIYDYPLGQAMDDGYVKEPAVATRKNFNASGMSAEEIERLKLEDGIRLHENTKVELETYARETGNKLVKPFLLIIARDTTHAAALLRLIQSDEFFQGRYKEKVIQVDSSQTGEKEDEMIQKLLAVESTTEPTEIVIHVNMLKEGWDVTNLYTIVPLRAANARILIEQSIGRGLRLPYGKRTGVDAVDRLSIVAHDRFQEIVDEAKKPDSTIRLKQIILPENPEELVNQVIVASPNLDSLLGFTPQNTSGQAVIAPPSANKPPVFTTPEEKKVVEITSQAIHRLAKDPASIPSVSYLQHEHVKENLLREVQQSYQSGQLQLEGIIEKPDFSAIINKTVDLMIQNTIDIPRISVVPKGDVISRFKPFQLDLKNYTPIVPDESLWVQYLRSGENVELGGMMGGIEEDRLENYIVAGLIDFNDVSYDENADLLYDLADQVVEHLKSYLSEQEITKVLRYEQRKLAKLIHAQMLEHYEYEASEGYEVRVHSGFSPLKESAYTTNNAQSLLPFKLPPKDKSNMARYVFAGFSRCLYPIQKFDSDTERQLAVILDRDSLKWFRPVRGQFQIYYMGGRGEQEYQPDFVAEAEDCIYMLEPKAAKNINDADVLAKTKAAVQWCENASHHAKTYNGKPWVYLLIPHDQIAENMTLNGLRKAFECLGCES